MQRKLLIVDDNAMNRFLLRNTLCEEYEIIEAQNGLEALDTLERLQDALSAVLLDVVMPEMDGYEVLRRIRDDLRLAQIPIIMVTGFEDEESRIKALSQGANDFLIKPFSPEIIRHCVKNNIALRETASRLNAMQKDKLTGLLNREAFFEKAAEMIAQREPGYYLISCFDVDNFKLINDQYGSLEGDQILHEIGRTVREDMEAAGGLAGRISGDNFAVLLPQSERELSITRIVRENRMAYSAKQAVVFSVGRYLITDPTLPVSACYDRAYIAKSSIKNRYDQHIAYFDEAMLKKLLHAQQINEDVDVALSKHQFEVWYQPQRNHISGALVGAEALVRWRHPERGLIPPGDFIPIFERNGFIYQLDKYVWTEVCRQLRNWLDRGLNPAPVSVNISRYDIFQPGFLEVLPGLLEKYRLPVELLRLEITESAFAHSTQTVVDMVTQLINQGFTVEIDDFGSGYSSLNTLKNVPAQVVKLDMRFLEDDNDAERGGNILESVVRMIKWLGVSVVAEGVEHKAQADYLASIGCSCIQGYFYAYPMPVAEYEVYCRGIDLAKGQLSLNTVENLDNNAFWDPKSMDTLIFNSYIGAACIFEYHNHHIELLRVNQKFSAILGDGTMSVEDTLKLDWINCLAPESRALVQDVLLRSYETREEYTNEYVFLNIPGAPAKTYLRATMRVIATVSQRMLVYCTSENCTAQRQAEENELRAIEQLQAIMRDIGTGITATCHPKKDQVNLLFSNEKFYTIHGYTREQYTAEVMDYLALIHPDDRQQVYTATMSADQTQQPAQLEYRVYCRDKSLRWLRMALSFTRFTGIEQNIRLCIFTDITSEKQNEERLLETILSDMPGGLVRVLVSPDGTMRPVYFNEGFTKLIAMSSEELMARYGNDALSALHPDDVDEVKSIAAALLAGSETHPSRYRLKHGRGGYIRLSSFKWITRDPSGQVCINIYFTDAATRAIEETAQKELLDNLPDCVGLYEYSQGQIRILYRNKSYRQLLGWESEDDTQLPALATVHPEDAPLFKQELCSAIRQQRNMACDFRLRREASDYYPVHLAGRIVLRKSEVYWVYVTLTPIAEAAMFRQELRPVAMQADSTSEVSDIKGRDMTEARQAQSRLEMLANNIPGGIAAYEGDPITLETIQLTYFSDGFCRLFGYSRAEYARLSADNPLSLVFAADLSKIREKVFTLIRDGITLDHSYRATVNGGAVKWINVRAALGEPNGSRVTVNAVFLDVTEQRNTLEKLRMSEEINRIAIQQGTGMVCRYDVATKQLTLSENANAIFETAAIQKNIPEEAIREGKISPDTADAYRAFYESIARGEKSGIVCYQRASTQGWRWLEAHFTTIFRDNGEPVTAVISLFDITERIEKEAAYKKWQQSLSSRQPETYSLYRCNVSKGLILDGKEGLLLPENLLVETANLAKRTANYGDVCVYGEDRERYLSFMNQDALLLRYNLGRRSDVLDFREKRPEGGVRWLRVTIDFVDSPYIADVEAYILFEDIDRVKQAELEIIERAEKDPLTGVLNRTMFITKVGQLIAKQRRGTMSALFLIDLDGFKQVNDSFGHAAGDETLIEIGQKLRDSFRAQDLVCRIGGDEFMVFMGEVALVSAVRERAALVCALLHKSFSLQVQLSASIGISLCPENGTEFEALYRKADTALYQVKSRGKDGYALYSEDMSERTLTPQEKTEKKTETSGRHHNAPKRRMLIVEDNEINRDYLANLFEDEFIIDTAAEGTAALTRLKRYGAGISIVLLDLRMPGLDGFAVLQRMRESLIMQTIPVIVVSGMNERETCLKAIRAGATDYITKPVDAELLKLRVSSAISKVENEQLRAQNRYLAMQNEEAKRLAEARRHSEELSVALHAAERADLAKSQFLSSMSHEIRTPLNAVIGYNIIAKNEITEAKTDEARRQVSMKVMDCLTKSEVASRHLLTIINDVLDMSAIESGKMKVDDSPFDFKSLITSLTVLFFAQAKAKGIEFEVLFDKPTEEWFIGDQLRVNQILTNLLSNAVKFTPEGGNVTLTITENSIDQTSTGFRFEVSDTGIGMTHEYLEHIWTPFEQAESSISRRFGGSGLGLSITKNLVELMGGSIEVDSKSGVGSTFRVDLTFTRTEQPQKPLNYDFSTVNALVVDDDKSTCDYIKLLFDRCDARCTVLSSGREAVDAFTASLEQGRPFNLCLVDWRMPQMDGFSTISEIRRIAAKNLPIVVVTAYDFSEVSEHAERLGISRFVSKPLFQSSLYDLLATISGQQAALSVESSPHFDFDGARILLAEDNNMNMEVAKHILTSAKLAVDSAWNGQEAIDIFAASQPGTYKAILMDIHMPEVDGYQATRMIRASSHRDAASIPIIAMTADAFAEDVAEAHRVGMNDHIAKPIDVDSLYRILSQYMEGK